MRKTILCCLYLIIPIVSIYAQSNYKEGYVITLENDTIYGWIDFRMDHINSVLCKFKERITEPEKVYHPGEIDAYRFINEGKYYVSRTVEIDSIEKKVFLEYLVQGMMNLYYLPDGNGYYFFENKDGSLDAITKKPDEIIDNSKLKVDNRYKGMLAYVFRDCPPLSVESSDAGFDRKSMIDYTKSYHDQMCSSGEKCIIFENDYKKKFTKFDFSFFSGFEFNEIKLLQIYDIYPPKMISFSPVIGAGLNISSPRFMKSLNFIFDVTLSKIVGACDFTHSYYVTFSQFNFSAIKSNMCGGLEYIYHKGKIRPAINAGISYSHLYNIKSTIRNNSQAYTNLILPPKYSTGIKTGLGVDYQLKGNQYIIVRILYLKHFENYDMNNTYQLKLGYKF